MLRISAEILFGGAPASASSLIALTTSSWFGDAEAELRKPGWRVEA